MSQCELTANKNTLCEVSFSFSTSLKVLPCVCFFLLFRFVGWKELAVIVVFVSQQWFQPKPLEEVTVEQPPDDVEIEPDEQSDAFTVSESMRPSYTNHCTGSPWILFQTLRIAVRSYSLLWRTNMKLCCLVLVARVCAEWYSVDNNSLSPLLWLNGWFVCFMSTGLLCWWK